MVMVFNHIKESETHLFSANHPISGSYDILLARTRGRIHSSVPDEQSIIRLFPIGNIVVEYRPNVGKVTQRKGAMEESHLPPSTYLRSCSRSSRTRSAHGARVVTCLLTPLFIAYAVDAEGVRLRPTSICSYSTVTSRMSIQPTIKNNPLAKNQPIRN